MPDNATLAFASNATLAFANATDARGGGSDTAGLVIAIVQSIVFVLLGPAVLLYGDAVKPTVIFMQAVFAANYVAFVGDFAAITATTAFDVFGRCVTLVTATLSLTFTMLRSEQANNIAQGAVLGALIALPLLQWVRDLLIFNWVGCTDIGEKTPTFPDGEPLGCDQNSPKFQVAFQVTKVLFWMSTLGTALIGKHVAIFALCMTGSTMTINGVIDLIKRISVIAIPDDAQSIILTIEPIRAFVGYGLAAIGVLIQRQIMRPKRPADEGKGKPEARGVDLLKHPSEVTSCLRCLVSPRVVKCLVGPVLAFNGFLSNRMEEKPSAVTERDLFPRRPRLSTLGAHSLPRDQGKDKPRCCP